MVHVGHARLDLANDLAVGAGAQAVLLAGGHRGGKNSVGRADLTMRILIFHGYLLRGTGSNIYNANLARALAALGHEVDLLCQDRELGRARTG